MNRHVMAAVGALFASAIIVGAALADEAAPSSQPATRGQGALGGRFGLTPEQKAKAKEIFEAARTAAEQATDVESKIKVLKDALEKINTDVLTEQQRKVLDSVKDKLGQARDGMLAALEKLKLSPEQRAKVKEIMDAAREEAQKATDPEGKIKAIKDAIEKVKASVLTDEQRKEIADIKDKVVQGLDQFKLTDEQKAKAKEIMDAAKAEAEKASDGQAKIKAVKDALEKIKTDVLTDDQRKAVEAIQGKFDRMRQLFQDRPNDGARPERPARAKRE